jgi:hypothetical protein
MKRFLPKCQHLVEFVTTDDYRTGFHLTSLSLHRRGESITELIDVMHDLVSNACL